MVILDPWPEIRTFFSFLPQVIKTEFLPSTLTLNSLIFLITYGHLLMNKIRLGNDNTSFVNNQLLYFFWESAMDFFLKKVITREGSEYGLLDFFFFWRVENLQVNSGKIFSKCCF